MKAQQQKPQQVKQATQPAPKLAPNKESDPQNRDGYKNQQDQGQWLGGENRDNADQNTEATNNRPTDEGVREVPFENDTPHEYTPKGVE